MGPVADKSLSEDTYTIVDVNEKKVTFRLSYGWGTRYKLSFNSFL